jgi:DNA-binding HxlR family transcriptional regulator
MSTALSSDLEALGRHRWTVPLLALCAARGGGVRFVEALHALSTNRESLARTLEAALASGWLMRNAGHGHPLRPEYLLTPAGAALAPLCAALEAARAAAALAPASLSRWSLPVLHLVGQGTHRFAGLSQALPQSNPRALTQSLKALIGQDLLTRQVLDRFPPVPEYHLSARGTGFVRAMQLSRQDRAGRAEALNLDP